MPERDIESLGVMGWGLEATKFFRRRRPRPLGPKGAQGALGPMGSGLKGPWAQWAAGAQTS